VHGPQALDGEQAVHEPQAPDGRQAVHEPRAPDEQQTVREPLSPEQEPLCFPLTERLRDFQEPCKVLQPVWPRLPHDR